MVANLKEIKKLSPEERIKRLKKIEEENKKEINEAEKLIKDSIREINIQEEIKDLQLAEWPHLLIKRGINIFLNRLKRS